MISVKHENFSSTARAVFGEVSFCIDGSTWFPDPHWNDFVLVLANWWLDAISNLRHSGFTTRLCFMDGPYEVLVARVQNNKVRLQFIRSGQQISESSEVYQKLKGDIRQFAQHVLSFCDTHKVKNSDVEALRSKLDE